MGVYKAKECCAAYGPMSKSRMTSRHVNNRCVTPHQEKKKKDCFDLGKEKIYISTAGENLTSFTYIGGSQHVLRVNECPEKTHQLDSPSQLWVRVTNHLLDHNIYQQNILENTHKMQLL